MIADVELNNLIEWLAQVYRNILAADGINASGKLSQFDTDFALEDNHFRIYFYLEPYWKWVEDGRPPGKMPPISAIEDWIRIKPIVPESRNGKVPDTKQLAYLISRKIGRDGYEGKKPMDRALHSFEGRDIIERIKNELINIIINENIR